MTNDLIRYDVLVQDSLRGVVRKVLREVADTGLPGEHHFYIAFDTTAPGVRMSSRLRQQHPEEMTVVLQHQFWGLSVSEHAFEVGLSFSSVPERLLIPFAAIKGFYDPTVRFALQFDPPASAADNVPEGDNVIPGQSNLPSIAPQDDLVASASDETVAEEAEADEESTGSGAEVVSLDAFRKKT